MYQNFEHEFVHYLDGLFNLYGSFADKPKSTIWWLEGLAEYVSKADNNITAVDTIFDVSTDTLSEVFDKL